MKERGTKLLNHLKWVKYQLTIVFQNRLRLPRYKGATFRGGFGNVFRQTVCSCREMSNCSQCLLTNLCPYLYIFESKPNKDTPVLSKYENIPRPFLIEPPIDEKTFYEPGDTLQLSLVLFGQGIDYFPYFVMAFRELGKVGIGIDRGKFSLQEIWSVNDLTGEKSLVYDNTNGQILPQNIVLDGSSIPPWQGESITVNFLTMTRLKYNGCLVDKLEFHILIRNLLRRLSSLSFFHHNQKLELSYLPLIEEAKKVSYLDNNTYWVDWERYSTRQKSKMLMGGLLGKITFEGDLAPYWPFLYLGQFFHVGKGCVFGLGKYSLHIDKIGS